jgi:hypothetical protein
MTDTAAGRDAGLMAAADALMDAIGVAVMRSFDRPEGWSSKADAETLTAFVFNTLLSERQRGREEMRDRAAAVCKDHMEGRYHLSDLATHVGDKPDATVHYAAGNALGEARAAIRALPLTTETDHG